MGSGWVATWVAGVAVAAAEMTKGEAATSEGSEPVKAAAVEMVAAAAGDVGADSAMVVEERW